MGIFKELFGSRKPSNQLNPSDNDYNWIKLKSTEQIDEMMQLSEEKLVVVFKHSTRCGISRMAWNQFQTYADFDPEKVYLYYLDLLSFREVSDKIAADFQVLHQSPQMLIIKNREVIHSSSHSSITPSIISEYLN